MHSRTRGTGRKPENAVRRAKELKQAGKHREAREVLHAVVTNRPSRQWDNNYHNAVVEYLELSIEEQAVPKEALTQCRTLCQHTDLNSLERIISIFLEKVKARVDEAKAKAEAQAEELQAKEAAADVLRMSPEELLMKFVTGESAQDRNEREVVTPWLRYYWESLKVSMDLLRNNAKLEQLYANTVNRAYDYCYQYQRVMEFKKLCDLLRSHVSNLIKFKDNQQSTIQKPDLNNPETVDLYQKNRIRQLEVACDLELWQDAYKSIEDIQKLREEGKRKPSPYLMITYYAKLTLIFKQSNDHLYRAYAWFNLYNHITKYRAKDLTPKDHAALSSAVLLSALSVPSYTVQDALQQSTHDTANQEELNRKMAQVAQILGFQLDSQQDARKALSRENLLQELVSRRVLDSVVPEALEIYKLLEGGEAHPLKRCQQLKPLIDKLDTLCTDQLPDGCICKSASLDEYREPLIKVAVTKTLKELSDVYDDIDCDYIQNVIVIMPLHNILVLVAEARKAGYIKFKPDTYNNQLVAHAPPVEDEHAKLQLYNLAKRLNTVRDKLVAMKRIETSALSSFLGNREQLREDIIKENKTMIGRKIMIEKRKEEVEKMMLQQEMAEAEKKKLAARQAEIIEGKRRQEEQAKREQERQLKQDEERTQKELQRLMEQHQVDAAQLRLDGTGPVHIRQVADQVKHQQLKNQYDLENKYAKLAKQRDYFVRALTIEGLESINATYRELQQSEGEKIAICEKELQQKHQEQWRSDIQEKQRLMKLVDDAQAVADVVRKRREAEFNRLNAEREERIQQFKQERSKQVQRLRKAAFIKREKEKVNIEIEQKIAQMREDEDKRLERKREEQHLKQQARMAEIEKGRAAKSVEEASAPAPRSGKYVPPSKRQTPAAPSEKPSSEQLPGPPPRTPPQSAYVATMPTSLPSAPAAPSEGRRPRFTNSKLAKQKSETAGQAAEPGGEDSKPIKTTGDAEVPPPPPAKPADSTAASFPPPPSGAVPDYAKVSSGAEGKGVANGAEQEEQSMPPPPPAPAPTATQAPAAEPTPAAANQEPADGAPKKSRYVPPSRRK